jgi:hypothetical protein
MGSLIFIVIGAAIGLAIAITFWGIAEFIGDMNRHARRR